MESNDIPYSFIHGDTQVGNERRQKLFECDGIIMSTIDSCLGLDFKYVILCGIHYWDLVYDKQSGTRKLSEIMILFEEWARLYYSEIGKKIYSACSRAREGLFIIDDTDEGSPIKRIIRPNSGRSCFDEY